MSDSRLNDWGEPDAVLGTYVAQMDRLTSTVEPGVPLSLTVHGLLVTGELIPQWQWFLEVSEMNDHEDAFYTGMAEHMKEQSDLAHDAIRLRDTGGEVTQRQYNAVMAPPATSTCATRGSIRRTTSPARAACGGAGSATSPAGPRACW